MSLQDAKLLLTPNAYKASKLYAIKPIDGTGDATVTRNTTKTRVNSSGLIESNAVNVLTPDYLNGVCPALNVEGQRTNLHTQSEDFSSIDWIKNNTTIISNAKTSPDGLTNASKLVADSTLNNHWVRQVAPTNSSSTYTLSIFAEAGEYDYLLIQGTTTGEAVVWFNLSAGVIETESGTVLQSSNIKRYLNNIYRCSLTFTPASSNQAVRYGVTNADNVRSFSGDGTSGIFIWGAQIEEGTEPTSYIPTTTAQVTRSADTVTIPIPAGTTEIVEKYEDGTTNTITTIPASPYTVPTGRYEYILMK